MPELTTLELARPKPMNVMFQAATSSVAMAYGQKIWLKQDKYIGNVDSTFWLHSSLLTLLTPGPKINRPTGSCSPRKHHRTSGAHVACSAAGKPSRSNISWVVKHSQS